MRVLRKKRLPVGLGMVKEHLHQKRKSLAKPLKLLAGEKERREEAMEVA